MKVFLLLDQDIRPLELFPLAGEGKPVEIIWIGSIPDEVKNSFFTASLATYNLVKRNGSKPLHTIFACTIEEDTARRIYGGSGALAFAIATMYEMVGNESKEQGLKQGLKEKIGATGTIGDLNQGTVGKVQSINEKLRLAIQRFPEITTIYYPQPNDHEIDQEIKKAAIQKGIKLKPVKTLEELLETPNGMHCRAIVGMLFLFFFFLYGFTAHWSARYFLEHEYYSLARIHLHSASKAAFYNGQLRKLFKDFNSPLKAEMVFTVRFSTGQEETYLIERLPRDLIFSLKDAFAFRLDCSESLFAYIYQTSQDRIFNILYPPKKQYSQGSDNDDYYPSITNSAAIPGVGIFFKPPAREGNWDICIILSRWRCRNLEKMLFSQDQRPPSLDDIAKYNLEEGCIQVKRLCLGTRDW